MVEIGVEIEAGRLEMGSILTNDTGISSGMIALVVYARGLGLNRRYRLVHSANRFGFAIVTPILFEFLIELKSGAKYAVNKV